MRICSNRPGRADARSWALEAGLDYLLTVSGRADEGDEGVTRTVSTARRREVHRDGTLRRIAAEWNNPAHPEAALHARMMLESIRSRLTKPDWDILCDVGVGRSYNEIAAVRGGAPGGSRVQVLRLRRTLAVRDAT